MHEMSNRASGHYCATMVACKVTGSVSQQQTAPAQFGSGFRAQRWNSGLGIRRSKVQVNRVEKHHTFCAEPGIRLVASRNSDIRDRACKSHRAKLAISTRYPQHHKFRAHHGWRRPAKVLEQGLRKRGRVAAMSKLPEAWQRELLLFSGLLQAQLGK